MSIHKRPFTGSWTKRVQNKELRRHVPDIIVKFNGETSVPSCAGCSGRIDLQDLITSVSVSNSTDTSPANASISMSIPTNRYACLFRDNKFVLHPGLEVHVYIRGYFSAQELMEDEREENGGLEFGADIQGDVQEFDYRGRIDTKIPMKPYYQCFHGVITESSFSYGGGFYEASLTANDLFHFWQFQNINTNPSALGSKVAGNRVNLNFTGHSYTRKSPYAVIFDLYSSKHGDAGSQDFVYSDFVNLGIKSDTYQDTFWETTGWYWAKRFEQPMAKLKMYGADGRQFTTFEALAVADPSLVENWGSKNTSNWLGLGTAKSTGNTLIDKVGHMLRNAGRASGDELAENYAFPVSSLYYVQNAAFSKYKNGNFKKNQGLSGNNVAAQTAFALDIGSLGSVNIFEAQMTTKMDLASTVSVECGFEFYIDMNGDYVFKPPLFNLDTSDSRIYTIKAIDIISFDSSEGEPNATVMKGTGGYMKNMASLLGTEWENRGLYVDWKLVAKYGWREADFQTTFFTDPKSIYYACINRLYLENKEVQSGSVSIPLRPEMRLGFPVWVEPFDCFYYVNSISHTFSFGGECTTDLGLIAKRAKFFPPMKPTEGFPTLEDIDLENIYRATKPLYGRNKENFPILMGIPNVVMALDVNLVNPIWTISGEITVDLLNVALNTKDSSAGDKSWEQVRVLLGAMSKDGFCTFVGGYNADISQDYVAFYDSDGNQSSPLSLSTIREYFASLYVAIGRAKANRSSKWQTGQSNSFYALLEDDSLWGSYGSATVDAELGEATKDSGGNARLAGWYNNGAARNINTFQYFVKALDNYRTKYMNSSFGQDRSSTDNYLAAMSFMKSSFRPDDMQPGAYRYFTDAIPHTHFNYENLSGQPNSQQIMYQNPDKVSETLMSSIVSAAAELPAMRYTTKLLNNGDGTYRIQDYETTANEDLHQQRYGIKVVVPMGTPSAKKLVGGEYTAVMPTSDITNIMFAVPRMFSRKGTQRVSLYNATYKGQRDRQYEIFFNDVCNTLVGPDSLNRRINQGLKPSIEDLIDLVDTIAQTFPTKFQNNTLVEDTKKEFGDYLLTQTTEGQWPSIYLRRTFDQQGRERKVRRFFFTPDDPGNLCRLEQLPKEIFLDTPQFNDDPEIAKNEEKIRAIWEDCKALIKNFYDGAVKPEYQKIFRDFQGRAQDPAVGFNQAAAEFTNAKAVLRKRVSDMWVAWSKTTWYGLDRSHTFDNGWEGMEKEVLKILPVNDKKVYRVFKGGSQNRGEFYYSPVFPVSDNKGFEHFGSYSYGRNYNLSSFQQVITATPDYWGNLAPEQMADFLRNISKSSIDFNNNDDALVSVYTSSTLQDETKAAITDILSNRLVDGAVDASKIPQELLETGVSTENILKYINDNGDTGNENIGKLFKLAFANDIAKVNREYGATIATENVPISLAELDTEYAPFQCSGAAGSTALDKSFGFLVVGSEYDLSNLSEGLNVGAYVRGQSQISAADWRLRQEALRGNPNPDNSDGSTLSGLQEAWSATVDTVTGKTLEENWGVLTEEIGDAYADMETELENEGEEPFDPNQPNFLPNEDEEDTE